MVIIFITPFHYKKRQRILTKDLGMKRIAVKFVPRALTDNQKECRVETCRALKQHLETDPDFLSKVITGDGSWCYGYDLENKTTVNPFIKNETRTKQR